MSEEQKDKFQRHDAGDSPEGSTLRQNEDQHLARRAFIRKAAEIGGFTVLGLVGAETLLPAVLEAVGKLSGNRRLASQIAHRLERLGFLSQARAAQCGGGGTALYVCGQPGGSFTCLGSTYATCPDPDGFVCGTYICKSSAGGFNCNAAENFDCGGSPQSFTCDPSVNFQCTADLFHCIQNTVVCGGYPYTYTCPAGTTYSTC